MNNRKYLPTLSDLVDRLSITQLKAIFIPEHAGDYRAEMDLILHDIDVAIGEIREARPFEINAAALHAAMVIMLTNRYIWENESKARSGGAEQDKLLKLTHSINGVRNTAKNVLASAGGERLDWKIDALSADLLEEFGSWRIWKSDKPAS